MVTSWTGAGCFRPAGKIKLDFCGNYAILVAVMRDNERAITEGIRKRAEKGGDMSVFSVLPWLKVDKTKHEAEIKENLKRIGKHCAIAVRRRSMPNIV